MAIETGGSGTSNTRMTASIPSDDDLYWIGAMRDVRIGMLHSAHTAALAVMAWALVGWAVVVSGILFGVIGWSDPPALSLAMWILPIIWWGLAAVWALRVFWVQRYRYFANSPDSSRKAVERIGRRKLENLYWATGLWVAGVIALVCAIGFEILQRS